MNKLKEQITNEKNRLNQELKGYVDRIFGEQNFYQIQATVTDVDLNEEIMVTLTNHTVNQEEVTNQKFVIVRNTKTDEEGNVQPNYILKTLAHTQGYNQTTETTTLRTVRAEISIQVINVIMQVVEQFVKQNTEDENSESESDEKAQTQTKE